MDYKKPTEVMDAMIQAGAAKMQLSTRDLWIRGILSGAMLGCGTTLAISAATQTGIALVGAVLFPACFVIVVLAGLELVTGNFAVLPATFFDGKAGMGGIVKNLLHVFMANLAGGVLYAVLFWIAITKSGQDYSSPIVAAIVKAAETKTTGYAQYGAAGVFTAFTKGVLCNWLVTMGVVMSLVSTSTIGKISAAWLPILLFFAQGFEHAVVNMFVIPAGMLLGAKVSLASWWLSNQLPVTLGNLVGGFLFTAVALYATYGRRKTAPAFAATGTERILHEKVIAVQQEAL